VRKTRPQGFRFFVGLAVASALSIGLAYALLASERRQTESARDQRLAVVRLRALTEAVERSTAPAEAGLQPLLIEWKARLKDSPPARVIVTQGIRLEASTFPQDVGEKAAPRRLAREEKPLFDQAARLRAAVETNRSEGARRVEEIEVERTPSGGLGLAAPIEKEGAVVGVVQMETAPVAHAAHPNRAVALLYFAAPVALFVLLSGVAGERKWLLALLAAVLLVGALARYTQHSRTVLESDQRGLVTAVAGEIRIQAAALPGVLAAVSAPPGIHPETWDSDLFRRPRGIVSADGSVSEQSLRGVIDSSAVPVEKAIVGVGVLALAVLSFLGFGGAAHLWATLRKHREAYVYITPAMLGMIVLVFFPFLYGVAISFTDQTIYTTSKPLTEIWTGLTNYAQILGDFHMARRAADGALVFNYLNFYWTFFFTVVWTVSNVTIGVSVGLLLALILNTPGLALRPVYRVLLILPWAVPNYITALIWKGMFHQQFGVINQMIQIFGGQPVSWFEKPFSSFLTALATNGWLSFPFMMVISLGALQSIPAEIYEAARVEGATRWQQFKAITLPSLKPALIPAIIISVVWTFNMFNIIFLVTEGEPASSTEILITQAYKFAFQKYRYGYAAAYSVVIFLILLVYGTIQNRATKATEAI
jgi:arabinogalactan oligomer / maltooligosaccharide transport system permease protein